MKKPSNVTVYIEVFNEEERLEACLKSFAWADELYVFDKQSTDRTYAIAKKYATEVILVPFCEASENAVNNVRSRGTCDWCLFPTASSLMHPRLADRIIEITTNKYFDYDVIGLPYAMYSFGVRSKHSPFHNSHKRTLIRRGSLVVSNRLHNEVGFDTNKIYDMQHEDTESVLYHCTHKDAKSFLLQTLRYTEYEARNDLTETPKAAFIKIIRSIVKVLLMRRAFLIGRDGIGVATAYVVYFAIRYILIWDRDRIGGGFIYKSLRDKISLEWDEKNTKD